MKFYDIINNGSFKFIIPENITMESCLGQNQACPVAIHVSAATRARVNIVGIGEFYQSAIGYLQASQATTAGN